MKTLSKIFRVVAGALLVAGLVLGLSFMSVGAADAAGDPAKQAACEGSGGQWDGTKCNSPNGRTLPDTLRQIANILIFVVGAVSVIMVIVGGLRYTLAQGDSSAVNSAKNTVLYALVGVVVAFLSYALVNFVIGAFK